MFQAAKKRLYFMVARYFRFWATIKMRRWAPKVIVITGSAGKTTLLHLVEAQLGNQAHYSHHANSAFGVPFDILGMPGIESSRSEWLLRIIGAPIAAYLHEYEQKLYVVEADADRPNEAAFLAQLLKPSVTIWVSSFHTHTSQYEAQAVLHGQADVRVAVAQEYAQLARATSELVIVDGDNTFMSEQLDGIKAKIKRVYSKQITSYELTTARTIFGVDNTLWQLPALLPRNVFYQVAMVGELMKYLGKAPDYHYRNFVMPPGRSNALRGVKRTTLLDSTYNNSNIDSLASVIVLFDDYPAKHKWVVLGDMLEQGKDEADEHRKIAALLRGRPFERIILMGPRVAEHTAPLLSGLLPKSTPVVVFNRPSEVLDYLKKNINGGETILFKGARYLEGVIEQLLADKQDAVKLVRRGKRWNKKRAAWGLPS